MYTSNNNLFAMFMVSTLTATSLLVLIAGNTNASVHQIAVKYHHSPTGGPSSPAALAALNVRRHLRSHLRHPESADAAENFHRHPKHLAAAIAAAAAAGDDNGKDKNAKPLPLSAKAWFTPLANISMGTPPQQFTVAFIDYEVDAYFIGAGVSVNNGNASSLGSRRLYDQSASTSATNDGRDFTADWGDAHGHIVNEVLDFGGKKINARVGVVDRLGEWANFFFIDGSPDAVIGTSITFDENAYKSSSPSNISLLAQIAESSDNPIFTTYFNQSAAYRDDWSGAITFGGEDTLNCEAGGYAYTPLKFTTWSGHKYYHFSSASISNGSQTLAFVSNANIDGLPEAIATTDPILQMFLDTVGAANIVAVNTSAYEGRQYQVACSSVSSLSPITLTLDGNAAVTLHPTDYITTDRSDHYLQNRTDYCYLNVYAPYGSDAPFMDFTLGREFQNNHCVAYNLKERTLGIASTKLLAPPNGFAED